MLLNKKNSLLSVQNTFFSYLIKEDLQFEALTLEGHKLNKTSRMKIYFDAYRLRLIEILTEDFSKLHTLLGDESFERLSKNYIEFCPSRHFSVRYFGQHLSRFLKEYEPYNKHPYLSELAHFEWALGETLDAKNSNVITLQELQSLAPEEWGYLRLQFHPSLQSLLCRWDVPEFWKLVEEEATLRPCVEYSKPMIWIVWRKELQGQYRSLNDDQAKMLSLYQEGKCFAEVCEVLLEDHPEEEVPAIAFGFLHQCISDHIVSTISVSPELEEETQSSVPREGQTQSSIPTEE